MFFVFFLGLGGEDGDNAELQIRYQRLQVYENTLSSNQNLNIYNNVSAYSKWLVLKLTTGGMAAFSDLGLFYRQYNRYLFQFSSTNEWYLGLNRVVEPVDSDIPTGRRDGQGLCSVCVQWNKDGNLDPTDRPTTPTDLDDPEIPVVDKTVAPDNSEDQESNHTLPLSPPTKTSNVGVKYTNNLMLSVMLFFISSLVTICGLLIY